MSVRSHRSAERTAELKRLGMCTNHPTVKAKSGSVRCDECASDAAQRFRESKKLRMCPNHSDRPIASGKVSCQECIDYRKQRREWLIANGFCPKHTDQRIKEGRKASCQICENQDLWSKYRLTPEARAALGNKCEVCGTETKIHIDHNHKTGKVRGILCGSHNRALGLLGDSPDAIEALLRYIRSHSL